MNPLAWACVIGCGGPPEAAMPPDHDSTDPTPSCAPQAPPRFGFPAVEHDLSVLGDATTHDAWRQPHPPNPVPAVGPGRMSCVITPEAPNEGTVPPDSVTCLTVTDGNGYYEEHWYDAAGRRIFYQTGTNGWLSDRYCYHHDEYGGVVVEEFADDDEGAMDGDLDGVITHTYQRDSRGRPLSRTSTGEYWWSGWYPEDLQWVWDEDDRLVEYTRITTEFYYDFQPAVRQNAYTYGNRGRLREIAENRDALRFQGSALTWKDNRVVAELVDLRQEPHESYTYDYDECGRVVRSVKTYLEDDSEKGYTFTYNGAGQLRTVAIDGDVVSTWEWRCPWD